jgi:surface protein
MNNNIVADNHLQELQRQWEDLDDGALLVYALSFFELTTLLPVRVVNKTWRKRCHDTIDAMCRQSGPTAFQSKEELRLAIETYCKYEAASMEEIACTYGYPIDKWDVSHVQDMSELFDGMETFNEYIGSWNVSNVINMEHMFIRAKSFNQDINSWDVSSVTDTGAMFWKAFAFNQNIGSWDVSHVTNMSGMFLDATSFNNEIESWDVSCVENMRCMFCGAFSFNRDIGRWDVSRVTNMAEMFDGAISFNQDIGSWDVSQVIHKRGMFGVYSIQNVDNLPNAWRNDDDQFFSIMLRTKVSRQKKLIS